MTDLPALREAVAKMTTPPPDPSTRLGAALAFLTAPHFEVTVVFRPHQPDLTFVGVETGDYGIRIGDGHGESAVLAFADVAALVEEVKALKAQCCDTCQYRDDEPRMSRWDGPLNGPFCLKAGRRVTDDTPNDDDGNPIVVRCVTLGNGCRAWQERG
jgi:hypothetical protein